MASSLVAALVLAAGAGNRMQAESNKVFLDIAGRSVLRWSLDAFESAPSIDQVVIVAAVGDLDACRREAADCRKVRQILPGGPTRHASEFRGLMALAPDIASGAVGMVVVHDAVRPFASVELIERLLAEADRVGAAVPGVPAPAQLVSAARGQVTGYPSGLFAIQTPQAFKAQPILQAHHLAERDGFVGSDTASVLERTGAAIVVVEGSYDNIKLTTRDDLIRARQIAQHRGPTSLLTSDTFSA